MLASGRLILNLRAWTRSKTADLVTRSRSRSLEKARFERWQTLATCTTKSEAIGAVKSESPSSGWHKGNRYDDAFLQLCPPLDGDSDLTVSILRVISIKNITKKCFIGLVLFLHVQVS